ncbi:MAG TPA: tail fiber domain-containing protein, partial [Candidatus Dormibacteraeota bacterium]|nr:tail fiber domain-containing protein [Candidatus Dormibacteraeota bacterium]
SGTCSSSDRTGCEFQIYDTSTPSGPTFVGGTDSLDALGTDINAIFVSGRYAYVGKNGNGSNCVPGNNSGCEFRIYDVSNPSSPTYVGGEDVDSANSRNIKAIYVSGRYAFIGKNGDSGTCSSSDRTGCEFLVFDISNPASPSYVGGTDSTNAGTGTNSFSSVAVSGRYAFIGNSFNSGTCSSSDRTGCEFQIYDVSGAETVSLTSGSLWTGVLQVNNNAYFDQHISITGSATIGQSLQVSGDLGVSGNALIKTKTDSTTAFQVQKADGTSVLNVDTINGRVGVGTTTPADKLDVSGDIRVGTGTTGCVKDADATVIAGSCSSDARLKTNITDMQDVLTNFGELKVVNYNWRADEFPDYHFGTETQTGLIAQDVELLFPSLVSTDSNGYKTLDYTGLGILNIKATTELNTKVNDLEGRVSALESATGTLPESGGYIQQGSDANFANINVSGKATINNLVVTGSATVATLKVTGDATFEGDIIVKGDLKLDDDRRKANTPIVLGESTYKYSFTRPQEDENYVLSATPSWLTSYAVTEKTKDGFTIQFGTPAPANAKLDWLIVH